MEETTEVQSSPCLDWLKKRLSTTIKIREDHWQHLLRNDEQRAQVEDFLFGRDKRLLGLRFFDSIDPTERLEGCSVVLIRTDGVSPVSDDGDFTGAGINIANLQEADRKRWEFIPEEIFEIYHFHVMSDFEYYSMFESMFLRQCAHKLKEKEFDFKLSIDFWIKTYENVQLQQDPSPEVQQYAEVFTFFSELNLESEMNKLQSLDYFRVQFLIDELSTLAERFDQFEPTLNDALTFMNDFTLLIDRRFKYLSKVLLRGIQSSNTLQDLIHFSTFADIVGRQQYEEPITKKATELFTNELERMRGLLSLQTNLARVSASLRYLESIKPLRETLCELGKHEASLYDSIVSAYNEIKATLWADWVATSIEKMEFSPQENLIFEIPFPDNDVKRKLVPNVDAGFCNVLREVASMKASVDDYELPTEIAEFFSVYGKFQNLLVLMIEICELYNFLTDNLDETSLILFGGFWELINQDIDEHLELLKWNVTPDLLSFSQRVLKMLKFLHEEYLKFGKVHSRVVQETRADPHETFLGLDELKMTSVKEVLRFIAHSKKSKTQHYSKKLFTISSLLETAEEHYNHYFEGLSQFGSFESQFLNYKLAVDKLFSELLKTVYQQSFAEILYRFDNSDRYFSMTLSIGEGGAYFFPSLSCQEGDDSLSESSFTLKLFWSKLFDLFDTIVKSLTSLTSSDISFFKLNEEFFAEDPLNLKNRVFERVQAICSELTQFASRFDKYYAFSTLTPDQFLNLFFSGIVTTLSAVTSLSQTEMAAALAEYEKDPRVIDTYELMLAPEESEGPNLQKYSVLLTEANRLRSSVSKIEDETSIGWTTITLTPLKTQVIKFVAAWYDRFLSFLTESVNTIFNQLNQFSEDSVRIFSAVKKTQELHEYFAKETETMLEMPRDLAIKREAEIEKEKKNKLNPQREYEDLVQCIVLIKGIAEAKSRFSAIFDPLRQVVNILSRFDEEVEEDTFANRIDSFKTMWTTIHRDASLMEETIIDEKSQEVFKIKQQEVEISERFLAFKEKFRNEGPLEYYDPQTADNPYQCYDSLNQYYVAACKLESEIQQLRTRQDIFDIPQLRLDRIRQFKNDLVALKKLWDVNFVFSSEMAAWYRSNWKSFEIAAVESQVRTFLKVLRKIPKECKSFSLFSAIDSVIKNFNANLPLIIDLKTNKLEKRHWAEIERVIHREIHLTDSFTLRDFLDLELNKYIEEIQEVIVRSKKEQQIKKNLEQIKENWRSLEYEFREFELDDQNVRLYAVTEETIEILENDSLTLQNFLVSKFSAFFLDEIKTWISNLKQVDLTMNLILEIQKIWRYLSTIFLFSADIKAQLPDDTAKFETIHGRFMKFLTKGDKLMLDIANQPGLEENLTLIVDTLHECEKSLNIFLDRKRKQFPRFYFISAVDLLDILSKSNNPLNLQNHMPKLFDNIKELEFMEDGRTAVAMISNEGERVPFSSPLKLEGAVEDYLNEIVQRMRDSLRSILSEAVHAYDSKAVDRTTWIEQYPAQVVLVGTQIWWTTEVSYCFDKIQEGKENAMVEYSELQQKQIIELIKLITSTKVKNLRRKVNTLCMLEVHSRDVTRSMIDKKVDTPDAFEWLSQLRSRWDDAEKDCFILNTDASFRYRHEYLGNRSRLVITPLTDRCYITLTQSLHLGMGGAPAGPAGTGKTETVKDLGRSIGLRVLAFNCSSEMDYKTIGNIFKGLSSSGDWGCFDEFNRISVDVLSVVSTQVKAITDALKAGRDRFFLLDDEIHLEPSIGLFITMNPGYLGRTELPENLKALFRPVSMVVPDYELIAEIMLMSEGFFEARMLAKKFTTLYSLSVELLSKQDHYDWGLRAIKSVLVVAGALKRAEQHIPEEHVLMRALRDFNLPKIVTQDREVFMGLINDLFPDCEVSRKRNVEFETLVARTIDEHNLQSDSDKFVLKIVQLQELLEVRHSVFIIGPAGAGKTETWKMLARSIEKYHGIKVLHPDLNPKAQSGRELFGYMNPATRDWVDGLLSSIMRNLAEMDDDNMKWMILDGDIDTGWIESMNTVMDDNKTLTLASNERIPVTDTMRLLFEISHLKYATPATVSRAGILFINASDIGWMPYVRKWIESRPSSEHGTLLVLFEKYLTTCLDFQRKELKTIVPFTDFQFVANLCCMLGILMDIEASPIYAAHPSMLERAMDENGELIAQEDMFANFWEKRTQYWDRMNQDYDVEESVKDKYRFVTVGETGLFANGVPTELLEPLFVFSIIWVFGGVLKEDQLYDYKDIFSRWFKIEFKQNRLPSDASVYDICLALQYNADAFDNLVVEDRREMKAFLTDPANYSTKWTTWDIVYDRTAKKELMSQLYEYRIEEGSQSLSQMFVTDPASFKTSWILKQLAAKQKPVLLAGSAGVGKTEIIRSFLSGLSEDDFITQSIQFSYYTTAHMVQQVIESNIERKAGRNFGPPGQKRALFCIDDLNMPEVDCYGTQSPSTLLRQHLDYGHFYTRDKHEICNVGGIQYIAAMNPATGSFNINNRLQRHFFVLGLHQVSDEAISFILRTKLLTHVLNCIHTAPPDCQINFEELRAVAETVIPAGTSFHQKARQTFLPTAIKFHYHFNLRELSRVITGLFNIEKPHFIPASKVDVAPVLMRSFYNELRRCYGDRLMDSGDMTKFDQLLEANHAEFFAKMENPALKTYSPEQSYLFCHYARGVSNPIYTEFGDDLTALDVNQRYELVKTFLNDQLEGYKDSYAAMPLVFFHDAMDHILRIHRILEMPNGHPMLIGVGGSGKQSLARLAAFMSGFEIFQLTVTSSYDTTAFLQDFHDMFIKAGTKETKIMFLLTDSQIKDEKFLIYINDFLATGNVPEVFEDAGEIEEIISAQSNEVKMAGLRDTKENCWNHFLAKVGRNLRICLALSPVGETLRTRARMFPAVFSSCQKNWFHGWPSDALISVALRNLQDAEVDLAFHNDDVTEPAEGSLAVEFAEDIWSQEHDARNADLMDRVVRFMAYAHSSANQAAEEYAVTHRRKVYTTPKSFLELIEAYKVILADKRQDTLAQIERLEKGLIKLQSTAEDVAGLKEALEKKQVVVAEKEAAAAVLLEQVSSETEIVDKQKAIAMNEEEECTVVEREVSAYQRQCDEELAAAIPAIEAAEAALDTLNKDNLVELKSMGVPPPIVVKVMAAVIILMSNPRGPIPRDLSWKNLKKEMGQVVKFLDALKNYDRENIPRDRYDVIKNEYLTIEGFDGESVSRSSFAAAGLCEWVINIIAFFDIHCEVEPKRLALAQANEQLAAANAKLQRTREHVTKLTNKLNNLKQKFEDATAQKQAVLEEAARTEERLNLAYRLVNGLAGEKIRWAEGIDGLKQQENTLVGDMLVAASFISYLGPFNRMYRDKLLKEIWLPKIVELQIPLSTRGLSPLLMLTTEAQIARWNNDALPVDSVSIENAAILSNCQRWPLVIDPQLQGITWLRNHFATLMAEAEASGKTGQPLRMLQMDDPKLMDSVERTISEGDAVMIDNIKEYVSVLLDPIIQRNFVKKGRSLFIQLGDKEVDYDSKFCFYLQTKMPNPHYPPEIQAQTTLVNFTVTLDGLEEQLLGFVVKKEKPELEEEKKLLMRQQNEFKIKLKQLEDELLNLLSSSSGDILGNTTLVENLEQTKETAAEIEIKVKKAKETEASINETRELYRPVAKRAAMLYFILVELVNVHQMYQFSLQAFVHEFDKAIDKAAPSEDITERVNALLTSVTQNIFLYTTRGLFERHKLIFSAQVCFQIMLSDDSIDIEEYNTLIKFPKVMDQPSPVSWIDQNVWAGVLGISKIPAFARLPSDIDSAAKRWREWAAQPQPERARIPQDYNGLSTFQKLILLRALRPDRLVYALADFVRGEMGSQFVDLVPQKLEETFQEATQYTPMFFILSPGVDPLKDVEILAQKLGYTEESGKWRHVSLGQGQSPFAEAALAEMAETGGWVVLENLHLVGKWLPWLEKYIEALPKRTDVHSDFRMFLSAEPSSDVSQHIPQAILQNSLKMTNEPPSGVRANLIRAVKAFDGEYLESCSKSSEFKQITFALCVFHALIIERKRFGTQGWNRSYPFNQGDLTICAAVLKNFLEDNVNIPWANIRYIFAEIMYGGHIGDDWDRRLCRTYLETMMLPDLFEGMELCHEYPAPPVGLMYEDFFTHIDELPEESPVLFGMHPNAEIDVLTEQSNVLFTTLLDLQPKGLSATAGTRKEDIVSEIITDLVSQLPDGYEDERPEDALPAETTPFTAVWLQETDRMQNLIKIIRTSLIEVEKALAGELTVTDRIEAIIDSLFLLRVPQLWTQAAYPSRAGLNIWFADLMNRVAFLRTWEGELANSGGLPPAIWLSGLFNPASLLTAVMQVAARKNNWALDHTMLVIDVMKRGPEDIQQPPRDGAYIYGLFVEGAAWDTQSSSLVDAKMKEPLPPMPVIHVKAVLRDRFSPTGLYECPVYYTRQRGPTYVWTFYLKTRASANKWILAGVALILSTM